MTHSVRDWLNLWEMIEVPCALLHTLVLIMEVCLLNLPPRPAPRCVKITCNVGAEQRSSATICIFDVNTQTCGGQKYIHLLARTSVLCIHLEWGW